MPVEPLNKNTISDATNLILALWPECTYDKEYLNCERILKSENETIILSKSENEYTGFIQLSLRSEFVEGTTSSPVAYIEGIFIKPAYRRKGVGTLLVEAGGRWGLSKGVSEYASDAEVDNQASLLFHRKMGFKEFNRVACFAKKIS